MGVAEVIIDTPSVSAMLTWLGVSVGVVIVIGVSFLAALAAWQRYDRKQHVSALERYLALVARQHRPTHTS